MNPDIVLVEPFQDSSLTCRATQGGASLTLGFGIGSPLGSRSKPRRNPEMNGWPHINGHAGDADVVSTVFSFSNAIAFVERPAVVEWAPLMAVPFCGFGCGGIDPKQDQREVGHEHIST